ncbi:CHAT domain-containing protein [Lentzea sp. NPDC005914]|uniref:CHAT domain-containing protein n=1 Tax=Lentzea sp. NPDC005914 TaxID=3154572 RepID=UPI0033FE5F3A
MTELDEILSRGETAIAGARALREKDLAAFVADLALLPEDHPERSRLAVTMLIALTNGGGPAPTDVMAHFDQLLGMVGHVPSSLVIWPQVRASVRAQSLMHAAASNELRDPVAAERELTDLLEVGRDFPTVTSMITFAQDTITATEDGPAGMSRIADALRTKVNALPENHPATSQLREFGDLLKDMTVASRDFDPVEMRGLLQRLQETTDALPFDTGTLESFTKATDEFASLLDLVDPASTSAARDAALDTARATPGDGSANDRARMHLMAATGCFAGGEETDLARVDEGIGHFREAVALSQDGELHVLAVNGLAIALFRRSELAGSTEGLEEVRELLAHSLPLMDGPRHPQWALANEVAASVGHRLGDMGASVTFGLSAQRSYVWRALLDSDPAETRHSIKDAAMSAVETARRCMSTNNLTDAVRALDTGRGLLLFAETELRAMPARLKAVGRPDLAERWQREGRDSAGLRREVLTAVLGNPESMAGLLDPPSHGEMRTALASAGADALVYLVPGDHMRPGALVVLPKQGPAAMMALPELQVGKGSEVERYLVALADRSREIEPPPGTGLRESVETLCEWAWNAAIGPLLETYFARTIPGTEPRIVLVPMGDLARIPWQAARRADGTHAVELAAFSQAVSARLFCENAKKSRIKATSTALVVGDPNTESPAVPLTAAREEAYAVRNAFYRAGRYVGRRPDNSTSPSGRGTFTEVREWLADTAPQAGTTLHLACHGRFRGGESSGTAELLLAPDDPAGPGPGELDAAEIMRVLAAVPERRIGLVVMAACNTGRSIHGYDEAYSLGTAFLAAGARTVLSTHWAIPDEETSALMFVFHHYLRAEGLPPWDALRKAQLWMLDPKRERPPLMPDTLASREANHHDVVAWAGFVHGGH